MHETNEILRKALHIAFGLGAVALAWLPWWMAAGIAGLAVVGNYLLLHRVFGRRVWRLGDRVDAGIVLYPAMVCLLIIVFRNQLVVAGTAWAILAFGDGFATLAGKMIRGPRLPWHRDKTWSGLIAFIAFGVAGALPMFQFLGGQELQFRSVLFVTLSVIAAALVESLPLRIDDNVTVPWAAAFVLAPLLEFSPRPEVDLTRNALLWLVGNTLLAILGYLARAVDVSGMIGGWIIGAVIIVCGGWPIYAALLVFFIIGTAGTRLGYRVKEAEGIAQEKGGRRGFRHAFANAGVAALISVWMAYTDHSEILFLAALASLATAAADTAGSEFGQLFGRHAFLPLTFERVLRGTEGAVSIEGTAAGAAAAFIVAAAGIAAASRYAYAPAEGLWPAPAMRVLIIGAIAVVAAYLESITGSINRRHGSAVPNDALNFMNTLCGALLVLAILDFGFWILD